MPLSINTNVASLTSQRAMLNSNAALETAFERLSTGKRINSAVDDAAGLSIGKGLESRVSGLNQAIRNTNDGISMVQIAEGAMDEVTTILQRMRDLAVQASNGSLSSTEQGYLDAEHSKLAESLGRALDQAKFNSVDLVGDFSATAITIQSGADAADTTSLSLAAMTETSLGVDATQIALAGDTTKVSTVTFGDFGGHNADKAELKIAAPTLPTGGTGVFTVVLDGTSFSTGTIAAPTSITDLATALNAISGVSDLGVFAVDGSDIDFNASANGAYALGANNKISSSGFTTGNLDQNFVTGGQLGADNTVLVADTYSLTVGSTTYTTVADAAQAGVNNKAVAALIQAKLNTDAVTAFTIGTAGNLDNGVITLTYNTPRLTETTYTLDSSNANALAAASGSEVTVSVSNANDAITTIDAALASVASERATLGATQAQLESTVRNLANVAENTSAAAGRIMDTDYAAETANLTKAQILQQAATSILAQANAQPQSVLSLLQ